MNKFYHIAFFIFQNFNKKTLIHYTNKLKFFFIFTNLIYKKEY